MKTIIEPFRIKSVEPIRITTREEREQKIQEADYNLFTLDSDDVLIDLLTDSGTSAMSANQWAGIQRGDESYAGSPSYHRFREAVQHLMPFEHIIPTHQGRAAEKILFSLVGGKGKIIPSNTHFDTTRANVESSGAVGLDLVIDEGKNPSTRHPFKGNMDLAKLEDLLESQGDKVPLVMITITNNSGGGQPVSLGNIEGVKKICEKYGKALIIDACRFAENAYFIKMREDGYAEWSIEKIVQKTFSFADGATMSAKKDALVNIGGWLALNDNDLASNARNLLILTEGFPTYGGLAGRDLEAMAIGLKEVIDEDYLNYRIASIQYLGEALEKLEIPLVLPVGGHAVYVDARAFLPHIDPLQYPGQSLGVALYEIGGIRTVEIGTVMFGRQPDGSELAPPMDLVRLAIPRRVYTQSHIDYVIECFEELAKTKSQLRGYRISWEPEALRHFTSKFEKL